jgi:UDP-N-acetylglucosamine transferase subunit ALG13
MMFVSVGGQKPFPRLCNDAAAVSAKLGLKCVLQTAEPDKLYSVAETNTFVSGDKFLNLIAASSVFVSHAGMGNILAARAMKRPIIIMPRQLSLNEHRNDHQIATAAALRDFPDIYIVQDELDLLEAVTLLTGQSPSLLGDTQVREEKAQLHSSIQPAIASALDDLAAKSRKW